MPKSLARALVLAVLGFTGLGFGLGAGPTSACAGELKILSGGAAKAGLGEVVPGFEASAGVSVKAEYAPVGKLMRMLAEGARVDIAVITADVLTEAADKGFILRETATEVGRVGVGLAIREGAPRPDISTPEAFKATLLAARSIVMIDPATGTSGKHLAKVFADLGIADALKARTTLMQGGYVVEKVARGEAEIGLHQITEILPVKGITLVGPLPPSLQKVTVYVAAITKGAADPAVARRFLAHLATPEARKALLAKGFIAGP